MGRHHLAGCRIEIKAKARAFAVRANEADMRFMVTARSRTTGRVQWLRTIGRGTSLATAVATAPGAASGEFLP
jgi:hypothetical protein